MAPLLTPKFELGDTVIETIGPEDNRKIRVARIAGVLKNGGYRTNFGTMYDEVGLASPRLPSLKDWRSIRKPKEDDEV